MILTYKRQHTPECCTCQHHKKEFVSTVETEEFSSTKEAMQIITRWNSGNEACWQYIPLKIS